MFGKYKALENEIEELRIEIFKLKDKLAEPAKEPVYRIYDCSKSSFVAGNRWSLSYSLPYTVVEFTFTELVDLMLKHTGMELSKEVTPAKTEVKLTKVKSPQESASRNAKPKNGMKKKEV